MSGFDKRDELVVHGQEPFNAETDRAALLDSVTATNAFYVRGHGPVPDIDPSVWRLRVDGLVERELSLSLETLQEAFVARTLTATLQCAGNRRAGLIAVRDIPGEAPWGPGATGTASWTGVALADVLALAGPLDAAAHAGFEGADTSAEAKPPQRFGGSIPLDKASRPEVLLAWEMNGEPLPPIHGAPVRVVVPGYIGARSVKWLNRIELRTEPWSGYFQDVVYRLLSPEQTAGAGIGMPLGLVALNSDVLVPDDGAEVRAGQVEVRGYAFGAKPSCSTTSVGGPGATGASRSSSAPESTRSSSGPGTPRRQPSLRTSAGSGTPRATSTTLGPGSRCTRLPRNPPSKSGSRPLRRQARHGGQSPLFNRYSPQRWLPLRVAL
jgi:sulfite oxidase